MATWMDKLTAEAEKHGATIDDDAADNAGFVCIDLPKGKVWASDLTHSLVVNFANRGGQRWTKEATADALERMRMGTTPCDCEECRDAD